MVEDAVKVAPNSYKVVLENDRVRVLEYRDKPGDKTVMHSHPAAVAIIGSDGKFKFGAPNGESVEIEAKASEVMYMDAVTHSTENVGTTPGHVTIVELK